MSKPQLFYCLRYADADAAIDFMKALGFVEVLVVRDPQDAAQIRHAQLHWRDNGGVMLGSARSDELSQYLTPGGHAADLVVETDGEVDRLVAVAAAAGGTVVQQPHNPPHGGRSAAVADPEGNLWNIDSYPGE